MEKRFREKGLRVVGLHAPEFDREKDPGNVRREALRLGVTWPVVLDNDFAMWEALQNKYWPTIYLVDRRGRLRHIHSGETHEGSPEALAFERMLAVLLSEPR